eukprot:SAG31_NODE_3575_length_4110_cov_2.432560_6_plen_291_part_00
MYVGWPPPREPRVGRRASRSSVKSVYRSRETLSRSSASSPYCRDGGHYHKPGVAAAPLPPFAVGSPARSTFGRCFRWRRKHRSGKARCSDGCRTSSSCRIGEDEAQAAASADSRSRTMSLREPPAASEHRPDCLIMSDSCRSFWSSARSVQVADPLRQELLRPYWRAETNPPPAREGGPTGDGQPEASNRVWRNHRCDLIGFHRSDQTLIILLTNCCSGSIPPPERNVEAKQTRHSNFHGVQPNGVSGWAAVVQPLRPILEKRVYAGTYKSMEVITKRRWSWLRSHCLDD